METFPPRRARSRKALFKKNKKRASLLLKLWALYLILWGSTFLTNDTYSFFTDSETRSYTISASADFCANENYAKSHEKECKCKGTDKENTGDRNPKSCWENGNGHDKNPKPPNPPKKSNDEQELNEQPINKAATEKEINKESKLEQKSEEADNVTTENQMPNTEDQEEIVIENES
ncbi:hypothetical protein [Bacillus sp. FJAT-27245]|uniref:hypothetical protein n=1 Tax=Bacillus sp. FJAT-27245 TaxID=1684144 RepID=UPI0006A7F05A|nr:hypothetical protein [Bacillus sp. FJAT-27245]